MAYEAFSQSPWDRRLKKRETLSAFFRSKYMHTLTGE